MFVLAGIAAVATVTPAVTTIEEAGSAQIDPVDVSINNGRREFL